MTRHWHHHATIFDASVLGVAIDWPCGGCTLRRHCACDGTGVPVDMRVMVLDRSQANCEYLPHWQTLTRALQLFRRIMQDLVAGECGADNPMMDLVGRPLPPQSLCGVAYLTCIVSIVSGQTLHP